MRPTDPFRQEHEQLLEHIEHIAQAARELPRLSDKEREALRARILSFLRGTLIRTPRPRNRCSTRSGRSSSASPTPPRR